MTRILKNIALFLSIAVILLYYAHIYHGVAQSFDRLKESSISDAFQGIQEMKLDGIPRYKPGRLLHLTLGVQVHEGGKEKEFNIRIEPSAARDIHNPVWNICIELVCTPISSIFDDWEYFNIVLTNIGVRIGRSADYRDGGYVFKITIGFMPDGKKYMDRCGGSISSAEKNFLLITLSDSGNLIEKAIVCNGEIVAK